MTIDELPISGGRLSNFEKVQIFHKATRASQNIWPPTDEILNLRLSLIDEELDELKDEFDEYYENRELHPAIDKEQVAKELADLLYVVYGAADTFGIPIDEVFTEVHKSNMSKLVDGKPLLRHDGKIMKGPNYKPPQLDWISK